ncbi:MAG: T9SS type A sorting domain-containing protein [Ignavibacteria bacterium]|nr:T9SS type A sorting domain-containing protein [Ignavibacteria bacterium]
MKIILFLTFINLGSNFAEAGWVRQSTPVNTNLYSVNSHHGNDITWACGENGVIIFTSNGGSNWFLQNSGTTADLYAIVFMEISGGPVFACGENGTMLYTTNYGSNWISINMNTNKTLRDISDFRFVAVGDSGVIFRSSNNGMNWVEVSSPVTKNLNAVSGAFSFYAVGNEGTVIASTNLGQSWNVLNSGVTNDLFGVPLFGNRDIAVGQNGLILRSSNFGINWYSQNSFTNKDINSVEYSVNNTSHIYCAGDSGIILITTDGGISWGTQVSNTIENLNSIFFYLDDTRGFACGDNGTILRTTDGGGVISNIKNENGLNISGLDNYILSGNYPNPFNPVTKINYELRISNYVTIKVYDVLGNEVATLINQKQNAGSYEIELNARLAPASRNGKQGSDLPGGVYFYSLFVNNEFISAKRMMLLK